MTFGANSTVVAQIHFRGLGLNFPFVDLTAQSSPSVPSPIEFLHDFHEFTPRAVRIWRRPNENSQACSRDDLHVLVAPLETLLTSPPLPNSARIELRLESYPEYRRTYDALVASDPLRADQTLPEELATLKTCAENDAFFRVFIDGKPAGFIAATPKQFHIWAGWEMTEELLHPTFRSKDFAAAMQQAFIRKLPSSLGTAVFGTIDARNMPSLKTALRVGRQVAEISTFVFPRRNVMRIGRGLTRTSPR